MLKKILKEAIMTTDVEKVIFDHHIVRNLNYEEKIKDIF